MPTLGPGPGDGHLPADRLSSAVATLARYWMKSGKEAARAAGMSLPQLLLIRGLLELGTVPERHWVESMGASPSATSELLDGLEKDGYLTRTQDAEDRRQVLVTLSPKGRKLADRVRSEFRGRWRSHCADIPDAELVSAAGTLERLAARVGAAGTAIAGPLPSLRGRRRAE